MKKICIVCPVRNLIEIEKIKIDGYVKKVEEEGYHVRLPYRGIPIRLTRSD